MERDGKIYGRGDRARGYRTRLAQAVALQIRDDPRGSGPSARVFRARRHRSMLSRVRALSTRHSATLSQYEPCNRVRHSPLFLFLFRSWTGYLIDIKRLRRVGFGMRLHELRHDQYTRNRFLDHVYDRRFDLQSTLLGRCFVSSRSRLLRNRPPLLGLRFLPFRFRLDQALRDLPLCGFRSLCNLCTSRCPPCCCAFGHHTLALIERPTRDQLCQVLANSQTKQASLEAAVM